MADITVEPAPPRGEVAVLVAVQSALAGRPGALAAARALSYFGEHSIGWLAVSAIGAILQPARRRSWLVAGGGAFAAHAAAVLIKRLVRRPRPHHPAVAVNVGTPSSLSFPSAHATSPTAAAVLHYPSDVATGVAVGVAVAGVAGWADGRLLARARGAGK
jgi:membrane-associated phospholipid phosphatase